MNGLSFNKILDLSDPPETVSIPRSSVGFLLLISLIFLIYINTFHVPWQFDDYDNIIGNPQVEMVSLNLESLTKSLRNLKGIIHRPVSRLTFGLNWYFHGDTVFGYHLVNTFVHVATAFILFIMILTLFKTPNLKNAYADGRYFISLLSAVLWASNPIQTQAVTYVVQRMAALAALFYLLSLLFYLKARLSQGTNKQIMRFGMAAVCFILAMGSKENAITLPLAIALIEAIFFLDLRKTETRKRFVSLIAFFLVLTLIIGVVVLKTKDGDYFSKLYAERPFTLYERVITQPKILFFYLSLIFYPSPLRLSIEHDVSVSQSILEPWFTLPAILLVFILIGYAVYCHRSRPLISFAVLFFFLAHSVESTILPLELVFEHRNYLPSLFLFLPISVGFYKLLVYYQKGWMHFLFLSFIVFLIIGYGTGTYLRNMVWESKESLWKDAVEKAPNRARPLQNLAVEYFEKYGRVDKSIEMIREALTKTVTRKKKHISSLFGNLGAIYYKQQNYKKAFEAYQKAFEINPGMDPYPLIISLARIGREAEAITFLDNYIKKISKQSYKYRFLRLVGALKVRQERYQEAVKALQEALEIDRSDSETLSCLAIALSRLGRHHQAENFGRVAHQTEPHRAIPLLCLIDISLAAGNDSSAERFFLKLIEMVPITRIESIISNLPNYIYTPLRQERIAKYIGEKLRNTTRDFFSDWEAFSESSVGLVN